MADTTQMDSAVSGLMAHWISGLSWAVVVLAAAWLAAALFESWKRRHYNLTSAAHAGSQHLKPDFLRVDREKRTRLVERGERYRRTREGGQEDTEGVDTGETGEGKPRRALWLRVLKWVVLGVALAQVASSVAGALLRIESTDGVLRRLVDLDYWVPLMREHWLGSLVALGVICGQLYYFVSIVREQTAVDAARGGGVRRVSRRDAEDLVDEDRGEDPEAGSADAD